jgi:spermidine/putrescine transport system substrate-binding protein
MKSRMAQMVLWVALSLGALDLPAADRELVILNWSEYLAPAVREAFEKQYQARVREVYYESDDARDQLLVQTGPEGFDLLVANGASIASYRKLGFLQPLPLERIPNAALLDDRWRRAFPDATDFALPYFWGTLGIAYRRDLVSAPITRWRQFFQPEEGLRGKMVAVKSSRDLIGMALKSLGYSASSQERQQLAEAEALLLAQKPYLARYGYITLSADSGLVSGDLAAVMAYGGDALNVGQYHPQIVYVLPEEGGNIWVDYFVLSAKAKNPQLAAAFLDFINQPKWAALNAEEMYLATPNREALKLLSAEMRADPVIFPDAAALANSEYYQTLSARAKRAYAGIFARVVHP